MTESCLSTSLALLIAITAVGLLLPWYNSLVHAKLTLDFTTPDIWLMALVVFSVTSMLSGFYPAFYFSSRKPIDVLRGPSITKNAGLPRKILVTSQFSIAIFLAIGVLVVYQQIEHARKRNLGYDQNNLVCFDVNDQLQKNYNAIKEELLKTGVVDAVTISNEGIDVDHFTDYVEWPGKESTDKVQFSRVSSDHDFITTMKLRLVAGRDFSSSKADTTSVIVNEAAVNIMGLKDPIGARIKTRSGNVTIIGITQDVVRGSPFETVQPCYIGVFGDQNNHLTVRLSETNDLPATMAKVNDVFKRLDPLNANEAQFVDERYDYNYQTINFVGDLARIFAGLAILLTCLGVVGLAAYTAEQKTKEIAIRKVLGATVASVLMLLSSYFVRAAVLSVVIASPVAWLVMDSYLQEFAYRIDVPWWVIPVCALVMLSCTLIIVFIQTFRAVRANPVAGLRRE